MINQLDLPIRLSAAAQEAVKNIRQQKNIAEQYALRIGIKGSGCSGEYLLGFDIPKSNDRIYQYEGLLICIDKAHLLYLLDLTLDYTQDESGEMGFVFNSLQKSGH